MSWIIFFHKDPWSVGSLNCARRVYQRFLRPSKTNTYFDFTTVGISIFPVQIRKRRNCLILTLSRAVSRFKAWSAAPTSLGRLGREEWIMDAWLARVDRSRGVDHGPRSHWVASNTLHGHGPCTGSGRPPWAWGTFQNPAWWSGSELPSVKPWCMEVHKGVLETLAAVSRGVCYCHAAAYKWRPDTIVNRASVALSSLAWAQCSVLYHVAKED